MATSAPPMPPPPPARAPAPTKSPRIAVFLVLFLGPVLLSFFLYRPADFDPATLPADVFAPPVDFPKRVNDVLDFSDRVGEGRLPGPEDLAYDAASGYLYTGCADGWIKRVKLGDGADGQVEDWAHVEGRPLGLAVDPDGGIVVASAFKGLLKVNNDKSVELLTDEVGGLKFQFADGVDVATDGVVYFTDASSKRGMGEEFLEILEARPYGRLMSFDPTTNTTAVLVADLYFANGVSIAPDQNSVIYCESMAMRCKRYHIRGAKKGDDEIFIQHLPGYPDNIRYDGEGRYWIGLSVGRTHQLDVISKWPMLRKALYFVNKLMELPLAYENGGMASVTLDGEPVSLYVDRRLALITGAVKVGKHVYYGSLIKQYISRFKLSESLSSSSKA